MGTGGRPQRHGPRRRHEGCSRSLKHHRVAAPLPADDDLTGVRQGDDRGQCAGDGRPEGGAKGGSRVGYRRIGTRSWSAEAPQCLRAIRLDGYVRHRGMLAHVNNVAHDWPPRLECVVSGRKVTVPAMSYWRARNKENEK